MRKAVVAIAVLALVLFAVAAPSNAGTKLAFKNNLFGNITSSNPNWKSCGSVQFTAPSAGTVVVSASGQAVFNGSDFHADLYLALAKSANVAGPWVFGITPGTEPDCRNSNAISSGKNAVGNTGLPEVLRKYGQILRQDHPASALNLQCS